MALTLDVVPVLASNPPDYLNDKDMGSGEPDAVPFIPVQRFVSRLVRFPD